MNQFLIIGNGYDLKCGLKSGYGDFFEYRAPFPLDDDSVWDKEWENLWDCVFYYYKMLNKPMVYWHNIEDIIHDFLFDTYKIIINPVFMLSNNELNEIKIGSHHRDESANYSYEEYLTDCLSKAISRYLIKNYREELQAKIKVLFAEVASAPVTKIFEGKNLMLNLETGFFVNGNSMGDRIEIKSKEILLEFFLKDLRKIEGDFSDYMIKQSGYSDSDYKLHSEILLYSILRKGLDEDVEAHDSDVSILTFNYTNPFGNNCHNFKLRTVKHVHGTLSERNLIFGIDKTQNEKSFSQEIINFTKTFRTLILTEEKYEKGLFDGDVEIIKIYGHSLCEQDYSYFFSIFDKINLYSGKTELMICYSVHKKTTKEKETARIYIALRKLLDSYGVTLDNKDHGKNLLHKIQLENRLTISELD